MDFKMFSENASNIELSLGKLGQTVKELKKALKSEDRNRTLLFTSFIGEYLTTLLNDMYPLMLEIEKEVIKSVENVEEFFKYNELKDREGRN